MIILVKLVNVSNCFAGSENGEFMKIAIVLILVVLVASPANSQSDDYYLIYGNKDGSPLRVRLGSTIRIPAWGATSPDLHDAINFIHQPLASDNRIIVVRSGGIFPDTLIGLWDQHTFLSPTNDALLEGFTNQSLMAFAYLFEPPDYQNWLSTNGDTVIICEYQVKITSDLFFADSTLSPFANGTDPANGGLLWGAGIPAYTPVVTFPIVHLIACENVAGDINNDSLFNALDVIYSVNFLREKGPGPFCFKDCPPHGIIAVNGDVNGNCSYNGIDVSYSVNYFKGIGPGPRFCEDCEPSN
jgi:hypothetical protein